ncbi:hypothetical protein JKP88DRAFT_276022 [Tribonema minus]|uniref:Uncharacterized protein n=1 Tax=Tribonema minus TaxID=303371 RepID=A0A835ZAY1_9STRA|nr:hypothetical protein JKP88DRAFT_276022 [Tribonema minus]
MDRELGVTATAAAVLAMAARTTDMGAARRGGGSAAAAPLAHARAEATRPDNIQSHETAAAAAETAAAVAVAAAALPAYSIGCCALPSDLTQSGKRQVFTCSPTTALRRH